MSRVAWIAGSLLGVAIAGHGAPSPTGELNAVQSLDYATLHGRIEIRVGLKHPLKQPPAGFRMLHPAARIVLDLPATTIATAEHSHPVGGHVVRSVQLVPHGANTRLVIHLGRPVAYETVLEGKHLIILLEPGAGAAASDRIEHFAASEPGAQRFQVRQVGFRRTADREGRVVVSLSGAGSDIAIREQGSRIIVDLAATGIHPGRLRRLDLLDFATPVAEVATYARGNHVQVQIEPFGSYEYSAYQEGTELVIAFRPLPERPAPSSWR